MDLSEGNRLNMPHIKVILYHDQILGFLNFGNFIIYFMTGDVLI